MDEPQDSIFLNPTNNFPEWDMECDGDRPERIHHPYDKRFRAICNLPQKFQFVDVRISCPVKSFFVQGCGDHSIYLFLQRRPASLFQAEGSSLSHGRIESFSFDLSDIYPL